MAQDPVREDQPTPIEGSTRRLVLCGVGLAGLAGTLVACGGSDDASPGATSPGGPDPQGAQPGETSGQPGGTALAKTSDIPVGGGKVFPDQKVVVTQPKADQFEAFSATCTHRGCTVDAVAEGQIQCPCHGSRYSITNAAVVGGPAPKPLPPRKITVTGDQISLA